MIAADGNVCRGDGGAAAAEQNVFAGRFDEIVFDLIRPVRDTAAGRAEGLGICARAGYGNAMKVGEERVHNCDVGHVDQDNAASSFVLGGAVHPHAVEDHVVRSATSD